MGTRRCFNRTVTSWCRQFAIDEMTPLSASSVSRVRSAFCAILLQMNKQDVARFCATQPVLVIHHVHDEACMRARSHLSDNKGKRRGKSSSIQNQILQLFRLDGESMPFLLELQAIANKTAPTLATSIRDTLLGVLNAASLPPQARCVFILARLSCPTWPQVRLS